MSRSIAGLNVIPCLCLLAIGLPGSAAAVPAPGPAAEVDELFAAWDEPDSPGAAVGVFRDGRIVYAQGYGSANLDYGIPMSPQTVLRTGSLTKQFVAMGIALLAEQGKLDPDDDIREYLPEMPDYGTPITLKHLLHHTSGIREYLTLVSLIGKPEGSGYVYTPEGLLAMLARQKALNFEPGERYEYSNSGYFLLAEVIARVSGTSAGTFLEEHVFEPLGMDDTRLHDDPDAVIRNRGVGYSPADSGGFRLDILRLEVVGDLGVITSVEDFVKWDRNFYENRLGKGSPELLQTVLTPGTLNDGERIDYAWGLRAGRYRGLETIYHSGSAVGYVAYYLRFPDQAFSVVVLSNLSRFSPERSAKRIADVYLAEHFGDRPVPAVEEPSAEEPVPSRPLTPSEARAYAGSYYSEELDVVYRLSRIDDGLELSVNALSGPITAIADDRLRWGGGVEFLVTRSENGDVTGFTVQSESVRGLRFTRVDAGRKPQ